MRVLAPVILSREAAKGSLSTRGSSPVERITLPGAIDDRLYFAQVREDPLLEMEALNPTAHDSLVVVGSGGCTALSLLSMGAGHIAAVDLNRSQNHLIELKLAAASLSRTAMLGMLGARKCSGEDRMTGYTDCRSLLGPEARAYWDARPSAIQHGVLNAGVTERFIRAVVFALRTFVHSRARIDRMLECASIEEQAALFDREWNTFRWRGFFRLLLNRVVFRRAYDPAFFSHLEQPSFAAHFRARAEHTLKRLSVRENYFLYHMLINEYSLNCVPPYLSDSGSRAIADSRDALTLVDGSVTDYLRTLPDRSVSGFALSNICEWLSAEAIDELFAQVVRTSRPNARLCFRNFVGWTEVPERWRGVVVEDRALGEEMIARDRAVVQRRIAVCRVNAE
jgi:S-adenosylmethionine-diacylglycerol 3-amino-3-carboxypropyl transferase